MSEYDSVVGRCQGRSDFRLLQWIKPSPIRNDWDFVTYTPRGLRSSTSIEEEGRGGETRLANVCFRSKEFGGFAKDLPCERSMFGILVRLKTFL